MVIRIQGMVVASAGSTIINNATVNANIKNTGYGGVTKVQTVIKPGLRPDDHQVRARRIPSVRRRSLKVAVASARSGLRYDA